MTALQQDCLPRSKRLLSGKTREKEDNFFQLDLLPLFIYYTPLPSNGLRLTAQETSRKYLFVTSLDTQQARANRSFHYGTIKERIVSSG